MKKSTILVAIIWIYLVGVGLVQGVMLPTAAISQGGQLPWQIVFMPFIIVVGSFFNRGVPGEYGIGKIIDRRLGPETYRNFMRQLKPELLFSCGCFAIGIAGLARTVQLGGPSAALSIGGFFTSGGVAFLIAHFISRRHKNYEESPQIPNRIDGALASDGSAFWVEAGRRRNFLWAAFFGWLIAGPLLVWLYSLLFPQAKEEVSGIAALLTWGIVIFWMQYRLRQLRCYSCSSQAFSNGLFFMKDAKCRNCGITARRG